VQTGSGSVMPTDELHVAPIGMAESVPPSIPPSLAAVVWLQLDDPRRPSGNKMPTTKRTLMA
jgi:hypothetical protein